MEEKFIVEFYVENEITNNYERIGDVVVDDIPTNDVLLRYAEEKRADRIIISKIYEVPKNKNMVMVSYSDHTSELIPIEKLQNSDIEEKLKDGCSVSINRFEPSWD